MNIQAIGAITSGQLFGDASATVTDVTHDSRRAGPGSLFVAVRGELFDAHKFIPQVMAQGAVGVISELTAREDFAGAWLQVQSVRRAMALAAAEVHHHPSRELQLVGIETLRAAAETGALQLAQEVTQPVTLLDRMIARRDSRIALGQHVANQRAQRFDVIGKRIGGIVHAAQ